LNSLSGSDLCDSSTLSLYLAQDFASASVIWSAYRLKRNWGELTATWNAYGSGTSWQTAGALGANDIDTTPLGSSGSIAATSSVGTEIQISLNPVEVQKLYDGTYVNYGFLIKPNPVVTSNSRWYVYSRNSSVTYDVRKPKLVINSHQYDPVPYGTYDQYTKALLHFDGSEGSYTFRDELQNTWTPCRYLTPTTYTTGSGAYITTTQKKFGTGSGYFSGSAIGDWIQTDTDFNFGSQDYTIESWIRPNFDGISIGWYSRGLYGYDVDDSNHWGCYITGSMVDNQRFGYQEKVSGSYVINRLGYIMPLQENVWQHIATVRSNGIIDMYLDGINYFSGSSSTITPVFVGQIFRIGNYGSPSMYRGYEDEFRISVGIARWTSNFTPPDRAYSPITSPRGQPFMYSSYPWI
jgi:hypothetical protein